MVIFYSHIYRGRPAHLPEETADVDVDDNSSDGTDDEPSVIVQLSNRVQDGTRCRPGSLDMCIQGKCQVCLNRKNFICFFLLYQ
jgi:hypothetical protein